MHHGLEIQEILLNILGHCCRPELSALARSCHTFNEPALDVLWEELDDLSPLARCLPEASRPATTVNERLRYAFSRPLTQTEWDILRSYTRRIRSINNLGGLGQKSIRILSKPPTTAPLFPNLCSLRCVYAIKAVPLLLVPLPSLISLHVELRHTHFIQDPHLLQNWLELFAGLSQNLKKLCIQIYGVQYVDVHTIVQLCHFPVLTQLGFRVSDKLLDQITPSESPLCFPNLYKLGLNAEFLDTISQFLSRSQLPAIRDFNAFTRTCPSKQDVSSFFACVQTSVIVHTIQELRLEQVFPPDDGYTKPVLGLEDFRLCMAFSNLRCIRLALECQVDLTDSELLVLATAWPRLECLLINTDWGWDTSGGITPNGLLHLLQKCQSLSWIGAAIDTRGYTEVTRSPASLLPRQLSIDVSDSKIEAESVPAIATFFAGIMSRNSVFHAWTGWGMGDFPNREVCKIRWDEVHRRIMNSIRQCS